MKKMAISLVIVSGSAFGQTPCDYDHKAKETYRYTISSINNVSKVSVDISDGARKCVARMSVQIDSKWYDTEGQYVYGPDVPESVACERAVLKGKELALSKVSPVVISSEKNMACSLTNKKEMGIVTSCRKWKTVYIDGVKTKAWRNDCD